MSEIKRYSVADILCLDEQIDLCKYKDVEPIIQRNQELESELARLREHVDSLSCGVSREEWNKKAWTLLQSRAIEDSEIMNVNIHTIRTVFNATYDALSGYALTKPKSAQEIPDYVAKRLHYPECWDTSAYPTVLSALIESSQGCTDCNPSAQIPAELVKWVNNDEPNLEMDDSADVALEKIVRNECRAFVKSQLEKMKVGE
jgi:hypothetical protein